MKKSKTLGLVYDKPGSGRKHRLTEIEAAVAWSPKTMHCTSAESDIPKTAGYRILTVKLLHGQILRRDYHTQTSVT